MPRSRAARRSLPLAPVRGEASVSKPCHCDMGRGMMETTGPRVCLRLWEGMWGQPLEIAACCKGQLPPEAGRPWGATPVWACLGSGPGMCPMPGPGRERECFRAARAPIPLGTGTCPPTFDLPLLTGPGSSVGQCPAGFWMEGPLIIISVIRPSRCRRGQPAGRKPLLSSRESSGIMWTWWQVRLHVLPAMGLGADYLACLSVCLHS